MKPSDVTELEERIRATGKSLAQLKTENFTGELLKIIHRPGWTSVAESLFVRHILNAVEQHAKALNQLQQGLLEASRAVGDHTDARASVPAKPVGAHF
jgi:hypothetical protein